jgi:hypothetical protein
MALQAGFGRLGWAKPNPVEQRGSDMTGKTDVRGSGLAVLDDNQLNLITGGAWVTDRPMANVTSSVPAGIANRAVAIDRSLYGLLAAFF